MAHNPYQAPQAAFAPPTNITAAEADALQQRINKLNRISLLLGGPGLILQGVGNMMGGAVGGLTMLVGTVLLIVGLTFYARMRGRHPAWGMFGLLSLVGMIVLLVLSKNCLRCGARVRAVSCATCGAPAPK
jgi:hypothetical protein